MLPHTKVCGFQAFQHKMTSKTIAQGAEAIITLKDNQIIKNRIKKSYRIKEIDEKLRKSRTRSEAKIMNKLSSIIPVPRILKTAALSKSKDFELITHEKQEIIMEFIDGKKLSENLESLDYKSISKIIGETIAKVHNQNMIHGDLTTSNMIFKDGKVYFIDFGLAFHSQKIEDKAVDLHLLQQSLEAKHFTIFEECLKIILENYEKTANQGKEILQRIKVIESRGRYREKI